MPEEGSEISNIRSSEIEDVLKDLVSSTNGLSHEEARKRLLRDGPNEIPTIRRSFLARVAHQIFDFVIILLLGIALVLALLAFLFPDNGSTSFQTSIAIVGVIVLSWVLIIFQMYSAERSLDALRKVGAPRAKVKRDGKWIEVPTRELVQGDIVMLGEGDRIPADGRIISSVRLSVDESSLTGESVNVEKVVRPLKIKDPSLHEMINMVFMSTVVARGSGEAVITGVGQRTELGKIAKGIKEAPEPEIPLQKKMSQLARTFSLIMLVLVLVLTLIQMFRLYLKDDLVMDSIIELLVNSVILSVVAVPWSFPIITTSVMARGMIYLVKDNAIVRRVASIEGLGRVSVICSDKTGTMTQNAMTVRTVYHDGRYRTVTGTGYGPKGMIEGIDIKDRTEKGGFLKLMIRSGSLNNDARLVNDGEGWKVLGDPTEGALKTLAMKAGIEEDLNKGKVVREIPFDSDRRMMTKVFETPDGVFVHSKGGFEVMIEKCDRTILNGRSVPMSAVQREAIEKANHEVNMKAERTLAFAYKNIDIPLKELVEMDDGEIEKGLVFLGFVGMMDPPKEGVREAVSKCREAGIKVVMITGDSMGTATAIASDLGVMKKGDLVLEGSDLPVSDDVLDKVSVFCRVSPDQKVDIVTAYRKKGSIIAMTGDGMNDAAALKNADVGVAMGMSGVDVAKEASQIILSDDNFATLVTAVHRGRQIFDNIRKSITYQIYTNLSELSIMFIGSLLFVDQMMSEKHLLFLYFSTHLFPVAALVLDRTTAGVMKEPPRDAKEGIVSSKVIGKLGLMIATMAIIALSMFYLLDGNFIDIGIKGDGEETIQTMILTFVVWAECINLFNSLSMKDSLITQIRERSMLLSVLMASIPVGALTFCMYFRGFGDAMDLSALTPLQYSISVLSGLAIIPVVELFKVYVRGSYGRSRGIERGPKRKMEIRIRQGN